ncbi:hypothetical protein B4135_0466 [Caldibacillus debilis]|uniref:Uncharacterized protein n=1 Tax=Caldibacillus debilis TaxID=301148 RepID=A0A150L911_9BACI|nr:hypothetical protein B4135_0466 [Caldibacillus debilis]
MTHPQSNFLKTDRFLHENLKIYKGKNKILSNGKDEIKFSDCQRGILWKNS